MTKQNTTAKRKLAIALRKYENGQITAVQYEAAKQEYFRAESTRVGNAIDALSAALSQSKAKA